MLWPVLGLNHFIKQKLFLNGIYISVHKTEEVAEYIPKKTWSGPNYNSFKWSVAMDIKMVYLKFVRWWSNFTPFLIFSLVLHFWNVNNIMLPLYGTPIVKIQLNGHVFAVIGWTAEQHAFLWARWTNGDSLCSVVIVLGEGAWIQAWDRDLVHTLDCGKTL